MPIDLIASPYSYYARTPSDMRIMREILYHWKGDKATAFYIGCANGEDFFSWIPVGWGLPVDVAWDAIDVRAPCVMACKKACPVPVNIRLGNFLSEPIGRYDFIIANRMWTDNREHNARGIERILKAKPRVLFTRGHYLNYNEFKAVVEKYGYIAYMHAHVEDDLSSPALGCICVASDVYIGKGLKHARMVKL